MSDADVTLNAYYSRHHVGVGRVTNIMRDALPEARLALSPRLALSGRPDFYRKELYERSLRFLSRSSCNLHPYFATANDPRAYITVHDTSGVLRTGMKRLSRGKRQTLESARGLLTGSRAAQEELAVMLGRPLDVLTWYPDPDFFELPSAVPVIRADVGYWGGWAPHKAAEELGLLAAAFNTDLRVWASGVPTHRNAGIQSLGSLRTADLIRWIDATRVCVYPSRNEGFGLPVYEALLRNRPVVVRDLPSYDDFLRKDAALGVFIFRSSAEFPGAVRAALEFEGTPRDSLRVGSLLEARKLVSQQLAVALGTYPL